MVTYLAVHGDRIMTLDRLAPGVAGRCYDSVVIDEPSAGDERLRLKFLSRLARIRTR